MMHAMRDTPISRVVIGWDLEEGKAYVHPPKASDHTPTDGKPRPVLPDFDPMVVLLPEDLEAIRVIVQARVDAVIDPRRALFQAGLDAHADEHGGDARVGAPDVETKPETPDAKAAAT